MKAVLLVNLGTPVKPEYKYLRKYLKQFLSDHNVVNKNRVFWLSLLNLVLLQVIPQKSAKNYAKIWNYESDESPLLTFTKQQQEKLQELLGETYLVDFAFTYDAGIEKNSIAYKIKELIKSPVDELIVLPLYPQYSVATTASIFQQVGEACDIYKPWYDVKVVDSYFDNEKYIQALADSALENLDENTKDIVCSFHGVPVEYIKKGDFYESNCKETFRLLSKKVKEKCLDINLYLTYQSKFGRDEWLAPATEETINNLAKNGIENIAVITPGFSVDCIETLEEINMQAKSEFIENGGKKFKYIECLNATPNAIELYADIVKKYEL
ncbi:MAG TPA: ferrochelatase [Alphaproteobacteria bacterium]|nr:ferrochelatase [Alphaproteobacteria bacterium]